MEGKAGRGVMQRGAEGRVGAGFPPFMFPFSSSSKVTINFLLSVRSGRIYPVEPRNALL